MKFRHQHQKHLGYLFAFSISFSSQYGMIGLDLFSHSFLITLYARVRKGLRKHVDK